jgi:hypothetical protein
LICAKLLAKKSVLLVLCVRFNNFFDNGGHRGNTAQALARWQHPVASSVALDVLLWAMHPALYRHIRTAIKIASNLPAFCINLNFVVAHNTS